jgi:predicted Zn finger-like uncharacterized protein
MPLRVACPTCSAVVAIPDQFAGKRVRCPKCKNTFLAPGQAVLEGEILVDEPAEEEEPEQEREPEEERPRKKKKKKKRRSYDDDEDRGRGGGLDGLFAGMSLPVVILFPLCCGVIALVLSIIGVATCRDPQARANAQLVLIISLVSSAIGIISNLIYFLSGPGIK